MQRYYKSEQQRRVYQLIQEGTSIWLYWVTVYRDEDGSFVYGRGRDLLKSWEKGIEVCETMCTAATAEEYHELVRTYLLTDQAPKKELLVPNKKDG